MVTRLEVRDHDDEWIVDVDADAVAVAGVEGAFAVSGQADGRFEVAHSTDVFAGAVVPSGDTVWVGIDGHVFELRTNAGAASVHPPTRGSAGGHEALTPPMSATVVRIHVKPGDHVQAGGTLIVLEAMKMELPVRAPRDATVRAVHCHEGELVQPEQTLIDLD